MALLNNKKLLVMGVANKWSIAWGIAKKFYEQDGQLIFTYFGDRSKRSIEKLLASEGIENCELISCDVTSDDDLDAAFGTIKEKFEKIDCVVHCIAHSKKEELMGAYYNTSRDGYLMAQEVSAYSLVATTQRAVEVLSEGGSIITLSYLGSERAIKNYNVMGVAKAALEASVRYLATDVGVKNIRVNAISAGPVKTLAAKGVGEFEKIAERYREAAPMRRMATVDEIAGAAVFLASDLGSGVTGEVLHVDCGYNIVGV